MNAKRAKRLRREAEAATVGNPSAGYKVGKYNRVEREYLDRKGEVKVAGVTHTTFVVHPNTTRAAYRKLKAAA